MAAVSRSATRLRIGVMVAILSGVILTTFPKLAASEISWRGIFAAVAAGICFACYLISMQLSFRKLHPVPVSIIQFVTIFVLTSLSLIFFAQRLGLDVLTERLGLIGGGVVLGTLTLAGYLLNNYGVRYLGAARASIIASTGPVLTALFAFVILPDDPSNALQRIQWFGILIVTLGVLALSFEKLLGQRRSKPVG
ncbi:MAG: DMT family transporter [Leptolyngbyaceae cyanobacterium SM1_3_5]|nr:DMT family transporter [Leptolyngbyaceae cyanobacterium SM1_3_5]